MTETLVDRGGHNQLNACRACVAKDFENLKLKRMVSNMRHWLRNIPFEWLQEELPEVPESVLVPPPQPQTPLIPIQLPPQLHTPIPPPHAYRNPANNGSPVAAASRPGSQEPESPRVMEVLLDPKDLLSTQLDQDSPESLADPSSDNEAEEREEEDGEEDAIDLTGRGGSNGPPRSGTPEDRQHSPRSRNEDEEDKEDQENSSALKENRMPDGNIRLDGKRPEILDVKVENGQDEMLSSPDEKSSSTKKQKLCCDICFYTTSNPYHMRRHKESNHEGIRYPCDQCEASYTTKSSLESHIETVHQGLRYQCDECNYTFTKSYNLVRHKRSKHGNIKYPCHLCEYTATDLGYLKKHKKRMHQIDW